MQTLTPVGDLVMIAPDTTGEMTAGGLVLPDAAKKAPETGTVLAVGDKVDVPLRTGDRVLYDIDAGEDMESDGLPCLIMPIRFVYGVLGRE